MEPFNICCTTCHARLRVRKAEALGTIVACPKCNGMVLIERSAAVPSSPDNNSLSGSGTSLDSRRPRDSAYDHVDDLFAEETSSAAGVSPQLDRLVNESFDDAQDAAGRLEAEPPIDEVDFSHAAAGSSFEQWRPWVLAAGAGLLGIAGAIGAIRLMVGATVAKQDASSIPATSSASAALTGSSAQADPVPAEPVETVVQKPISDPDPNRTDPTESDTDLVETDATPDEVAKVDPTIQSNSPDDANVAPPEPKATDQFGAVIGDEPKQANGANLDAPAALDAIAVGEDEGPMGASPAIAIVANSGQPVQMAEQLEQVVPSIEFADMPIYKFTEFVSDYTRVPITLRWESVLHAGSLVGRTVDVSVRQDTSMEQLLNKVLTPLRIKAIANGQQLEIKKQAKAELTTTAYLVSDVVKSNYSIESLSKLIQKVVRPGSWKSQGGVGRMKPTQDGRLAIRHSNEAHFEVVLLLEQLRVARGGKPLSTYPRELFDLSDRQTLLREVLTRPVTVRSNASIRLAELFRQLGDASGCVFLPDWIAIQDLGWSPDTLVQVTSDEMALAEMFEQIHEVLGLVIRGLDSRTIEITSPSAELSRHEFALYDLQGIRANGGETSAIAERIQQAIGKEKFDLVGGAVGIDPVSNHVIVRLPQSLHVLSRDFLNAWGG